MIPAPVQWSAERVEAWKQDIRARAHVQAWYPSPKKAHTAPIKPVTSPATPIPMVEKRPSQFLSPAQLQLADLETLPARKPALAQTDAMARLPTPTAMLSAIQLLAPALQVRDMQALISEAVRRFIEQHGLLPQEAWIAPLRYLALGGHDYFELDEACAHRGAYSIILRVNEMAEDGPQQGEEHIWLWHDNLFGGRELIEDYYL